MKPILCNTQVVQNILAGRQSQDRRPLKPQPDSRHCRIDFEGGILKESSLINGCWHVGRTWKPKYQPGDILYVRETFCFGTVDQEDTGGYGSGQLYIDQTICDEREEKVLYKASTESEGIVMCEGGVWKPNIHMPKKYARIFLKVTGVRVERIRDMTEGDVIAEGIQAPPMIRTPEQVAKLWGDWKALWDSLYPGSWERNDWVWVTEFERMEKPNE